MKIIAVIIVCAVLTACQSALTSPEPVKTPIPPDLEISLERGPCYGTCPIYKVTVDSRGQVYFVGKAYVAFPSWMTTITQAQLQHLIEGIEVSGFFALPDSYARMASDLPSATTTITMDGKSKQIWHYGLHCNPEYDGDPQALCDLEDLIDEVTGTKYWIEGEATITPTPIPTYPSYLPKPNPKEAKAYSICVGRGGKWEALGLSGLGCNYPTTDGGKSCTDGKDCQGACLGNLDQIRKKNNSIGLSPDYLDLVRQVNARGPVTGTCSSFVVNFSFQLFVEKGKLVPMFVD
jgi:hypothetical protein